MTEQEEIMQKQYDRLITARNFHYDNLNKWLMSFYVIIGALFIALYSLHSAETQHRYMELCIAVVGFVVSVAGLLSAKGYYYWETNWINLVHNIERNYWAQEHIGIKDYRVYSVFADMEWNNSPKNPILGANVSTTKVSLCLLFFVAALWGMITCYLGVRLFPNMLLEPSTALTALVALAISFSLTWFITKISAERQWLQSDLSGIDDLHLLRNKAITKQHNNMTKENKKQKRRMPVLLIGFGITLLTLVLVWFFAYRPNFSHTPACNNVDWGGFGDFFWGLGTMLLTALNVFVFYRLTNIYGQSEQERDKNALKLQQRQFEYEQKIAIIKDLRVIMVGIYNTHKMTEEMRSDLYGILNRIQVLRNIYSCENLCQKITDLRGKLLDFEIEKDKEFVEKNENGRSAYFTMDKGLVEILNDFRNLCQNLWEDLDNQLNEQKTDNND